MSKLIYDCLYYLSLAYLLVAGVIYVITLAIIFLDKKKRFFNSFAELYPHRSDQIVAAFLSPLIFALARMDILVFLYIRR